MRRRYLSESPTVLFSFQFSKPTPENLVRQLKELPPTPMVLHKLQTVIRSPDASMDQIAEMVVLEPGLAARMVRMAKSAQFGGGTQVGNVMEAIQRVGLNGVHEIVSFALASALVGQPLPAYRLDANTLWFRAVACALAASSLAECNGVDRGDAYTAGLMHGLGLVVLDRYASKQKYKEGFASSGYPLDFAPAEKDYIGFTHAEAGAALLEFWGFSENVVEAVRYQLEPEKAPETSRALCMTLATARWARSLFCVPEEKIPDLPPETWMLAAGIKLDDFGEWLDEVRFGYNLAKTDLRLSE